MTTWISDENGNRASVERWGSEEAARASLAALKNCTDCTDCRRCTDCTNCELCARCTNCTDCTNCMDCTGCWRCAGCARCTGCVFCTDCTGCTDADGVRLTPGERPVASTPPAEADVKVGIAEEAKRLVSGERNGIYGPPIENFERIARFWNAYLENTGRVSVELTASDISPMMRLVKEARICETPDHRDSHVDLVGYTLTGAEVNSVK